LRSKLNLKDEAVAEAAEFADEAEEDEVQAEEERLPLIGAVGGRHGVFTVVGVITEEGVDEPSGVVVTTGGNGGGDFGGGTLFAIGAGAS